MRKLVLFTLGAILFLAAPVAHASIFQFNLVRSPETVGSWYRPSNDAIKFYNPATVFTLELPSSDGTIGGISSGTARITDFSLPTPISNFGLYFAFTSVPSVIQGTVVVGGGQAQITFPNLSVDFERGNFFGNADPGTLVFTLTTAGTTISEGCAGRPEGGQFLPGIPLDLGTGAVGLVASVCPYFVDNGGTPLKFDNAFRLALRGSLDAIPACNDGVDNDGDGLTDFVGNDPGCADSDDLSEKDPALTCDDGADNDGDGLADVPDDPGCDSPSDPSEQSLIACDDGADNDADGLVDLNDPGCDSPSDPSEQSLIACDDGNDNDADGLIDLNDPGCDDPNDPSEQSALACDDGNDNDADGLIDLNDPGCDDPSDSSEQSPALACDDGNDNDADGLIDLSDPGCDSPSDPSEQSAVACDDGNDNDADGLVDHPEDPGCVDPLDGSEQSSALACDDGSDNDADGLIDLNDPGCESPSDPSEQSALACDDGSDNDGDGLTDYPQDPGCDGPADSSENSVLLPCDDGIDNDGDGRIDFDPVTGASPGDQTTLPGGVGDSGCGSPSWATENPKCQDGVDNDGDGTIDYDAGYSATGSPDPAGPDVQCVSLPGANTESVCGLGAELALLLPPLMWFSQRRRRRV